MIYYYTYSSSCDHLCRFNAQVFHFYQTWVPGPQGQKSAYWEKYSKKDADHTKALLFTRGDFVRRAPLELALLLPEVEL